MLYMLLIYGSEADYARMTQNDAIDNTTLLPFEVALK